MNDVATGPTRWRLADGRDLLFFSLPGHTPAPAADRRPLEERPDQRSQLRFDRQTGQWVIIAALRQDRTYKPPPDQCPLCPGPTGLTSEIPAPDYDVACSRTDSRACPAQIPPPFRPADRRRRPVRRGAGSRPLRSDLFLQPPHRLVRRARSSRHARLVAEAWRNRTADLIARPGVAHVFCFENRGEEIGVTLTHPHGQIYGYPYLPPRAALMLRRSDAHMPSAPAATCSPTSSRTRWPTADRIVVAHRAVHCIRAVRSALASRGAHLSKPVRAQPD